MPAQGKLLVGLLVIGFITWLWLQPFGNSTAIADDIEARATEALANDNVAGVDIAVPRDPVCRSVNLSGALSNDNRAAAREMIASLDGVSDASWAVPDVADANADVAEAEVESAATACRDEANAVIESHQITFRSGSPYINPASQQMLDRLAEALEGCSGIRIEISGHSNGGGRTNVNMEMSAFRATTVRDALVERGVPSEMLTTIGKGASEPLGENPGDPVNRRVDFAVSLTGEGDS
jgi:OOP family OmpA-OmpF porin